MDGRSVRCLLASLFVILAHLFGAGQTIRSAAAPISRGFSTDFASRLRVRPPFSEPSRQPTRLPRFPVSPPGAIGFPQLIRNAGTIFSGTVTRIQRRPATRGQSIETVAITFHVENAIRGASSGRDLTISQWIGLWSSGQRYRVGQRLLLFLYPRSKLGLTSSVAGPMGRFEIDPGGRVLLSAQHLSAFRTNPVLGGKSRLSVRDFALAVQASEEE